MCRCWTLCSVVWTNYSISRQWLNGSSVHPSTAICIQRNTLLHRQTYTWDGVGWAEYAHCYTYVGGGFVYVNGSEYDRKHIFTDFEQIFNLLKWIKPIKVNIHKIDELKWYLAYSMMSKYNMYYVHNINKYPFERPSIGGLVVVAYVQSLWKWKFNIILYSNLFAENGKLFDCVYLERVKTPPQPLHSRIEMDG